MSDVLVVLAMVNMFVAGGLATTVLLDVVLGDVRRRTYWNALWCVLNVVVSSWNLFA